MWFTCLKLVFASPWNRANLENNWTFHLRKEKSRIAFISNLFTQFTLLIICMSSSASFLIHLKKIQNISNGFWWRGCTIHMIHIGLHFRTLHEAIFCSQLKCAYYPWIHSFVVDSPISFFLLYFTTDSICTLMCTRRKQFRQLFAFDTNSLNCYARFVIDFVCVCWIEFATLDVIKTQAIRSRFFFL